MARGISTVGRTEEEAIASLLDGHPELKVIACEQIDLSDIPLRAPIDKPHWAIAFEDPDPSKFIQDADPIAKIRAEVRHTYETLARDPEELVTGTIEGPFTCPACSDEVNLELPPGRIRRRMPPGAKLYARCPECNTKLFCRHGNRVERWQVDHASPRVRAAEPQEPEPPGRGLGVRRACIFCGAEDEKISKEHLWSKWMREYVEGSSGGTSSRIRSEGAVKVASKEDWPISGFDREISGPCKRCNESWMGDIEREVAPLLIPMLHNEEVVLRPLEQRTIARWATLKMLVAQEAHTGIKRVIPRDRYRLFYTNRSLSIGAQVWIGRYNGGGSWPTNYRFQPLFCTMPEEEETPFPNAYLLGFTVGYLAFLYWGHEMRHGPVADTGQIADYLTQIWPATGVAKWPPPTLMEADGLDFVMDRFPINRWT